MQQQRRCDGLVVVDADRARHVVLGQRAGEHLREAVGAGGLGVRLGKIPGHFDPVADRMV